MQFEDDEPFDAIVSNPPYSANLFYGTSIAVNILVLSKHKRNDTSILFIDASGEDFFAKETNNNVLEDRHIDRIMEIFDKKEDVDYIAKSVDQKTVIDNDYNLAVSSYIEVEDTRPKTDVRELNERIGVGREEVSDSCYELLYAEPTAIFGEKIAQLRNYLPIFVHARCIFLFGYFNILKINEIIKCFKIFNLAFFFNFYLRNLNY